MVLIESKQFYELLGVKGTIGTRSSKSTRGTRSTQVIPPTLFRTHRTFRTLRTFRTFLIHNRMPQHISLNKLLSNRKHICIIRIHGHAQPVDIAGAEDFYPREVLNAPACV